MRRMAGYCAARRRNSNRVWREQNDACAIADGSGTASDRGGIVRAASWAAAGADRGARLRGVPHRFACRRRRACRSQTAAGARPRDHRFGRREGGGGRPLRVGDRVGVPWLGWTCGVCEYCRSGRENLCDRARFTGYEIDGGYAELTVADQRYCFPIDPVYGDVEAAPLMCAGLIGYRALRMAGDARAIGIYGFGAAAHIVAQVARHQGRRIFAFTRPGDRMAQEFARGLGAEWAGGSTVDAARTTRRGIDLRAGRRTGAGRLRRHQERRHGRMRRHPHERYPEFPYRILWEERVLRSVANLTRRDAEEFLALAPQAGVRTETVAYPLARANDTLADLRNGALQGAAVLVP